MPNKVLVFEDYAATVSQLKMNILFTVDTVIGKICLVNRGGELHFFKNSCPHLGVPFSQSGVCNSFGEVVCKEHGHRYSLHTGNEVEGRRESLVIIPFEIVENQLFLLL
jgi:nitrite reductase/ring-hydroxylating ferredoxin subunit